MEAAAVLQAIQKQGWYRGQVVHIQMLPPRAPRWGVVPRPIHPVLQGALARLGVERLYTHQVAALTAAWEGKHVIVATPTASGKSLCYHIPVLDSLLTDRSARALYLYPTKALAQDQLRTLKALVPTDAGIVYGIYDGDTSEAERLALRRSARVLLSNPDMLHIGILPNHRRWARFLTGLRWVVLDEAHVYRGVFGSHVANLIRRLRRVCALYGSAPQFLLASATLGNPQELAETLTGLPFTAILEDGAPFGGKCFVLWNPPVVDEALQKRASLVGEVARLFAFLVQGGWRTLAFVRSRQEAERVYRWCRDILAGDAPSLLPRIAPYRGAYLSEDRRRIERALFSGELLGVASTNALELGIDIGDLDATLLGGYPGSITSTWQQAGRSGRRGKMSLTIFVARDNPLDQFLMREPSFLFGRPHEHARIAPHNPYILSAHLLCAAYEAPLTDADAALFGPAFFSERVEALAEAGLLKPQGGRWHLSPHKNYPAEEVDLRTTGERSYWVVEEGSGRLLEKGIEEGTAFRQLHPGAVYFHQGQGYRVKRLDVEGRVAWVEPTEVSYYTEARENTETRILRVWEEKRAPAGSRVFLGEVEVTSQVVGFTRRAWNREEPLDEEFLDLPPLRFRTVGFWFEVPEAFWRRILAEKQDLAGGLHACEHAAIGVLPLFASCDRNDIGGVSTPRHPDTGGPAIFIHDAYPGGIGIAEHGFAVIEDLWSATLRTVEGCPCAEGCPGCIHSPKCGNNNHPLDKTVAVRILKSLLNLPTHGGA
ncbi:MAG: DEAD/DEAH box helicase [Dehalococcoidia bacterium]|nr:DEAD/DEAH box helicase [Dehalococcoidia bacterium]MDW8119745.1 DEAD/DEAH box helicase [Chloroflexota bacterium]